MRRRDPILLICAALTLPFAQACQQKTQSTAKEADSADVTESVLARGAVDVIAHTKNPKRLCELLKESAFAWRGTTEAEAGGIEKCIIKATTGLCDPLIDQSTKAFKDAISFANTSTIEQKISDAAYQGYKNASIACVKTASEAQLKKAADALKSLYGGVDPTITAEANVAAINSDPSKTLKASSLLCSVVMRSVAGSLDTSATVDLSNPCADSDAYSRHSWAGCARLGAKTCEALIATNVVNPVNLIPDRAGITDDVLKELTSFVLADTIGLPFQGFTKSIKILNFASGELVDAMRGKSDIDSCLTLTKTLSCMAYKSGSGGWTNNGAIATEKYSGTAFAQRDCCTCTKTYSTGQTEPWISVVQAGDFASGSCNFPGGKKQGTWITDATGTQKTQFSGCAIVQVRGDVCTSSAEVLKSYDKVCKPEMTFGMNSYLATKLIGKCPAEGKYCIYKNSVCAPTADTGGTSGITYTCSDGTGEHTKDFCVPSAQANFAGDMAPNVPPFITAHWSELIPAASAPAANSGATASDASTTTVSTTDTATATDPSASADPSDLGQ